jgi:hypothetical protein
VLKSRSETLKRFSAAYDAKHAIKAEGNKKAILILGNDDFPFPIPLYNTKSGWQFDTAEGRREILHRRIGAMNWMRSRPVSPMWMPRTNMPRRIAARASVSTRNGL